MEKRQSRRRAVSLEACLSSEECRYPAYIENISEHGIYCITPSIRHVLSFVPEEIIELKFLDNEEYDMGLQCEIRWVHINKTPLLGFTYRMGMEVVGKNTEFQHVLRDIVKCEGERP